MNSKAQGISINVIIIAIIALIVLVVLVAIFVGKINIFGEQSSKVEQVYQNKCLMPGEQRRCTASCEGAVNLGQLDCPQGQSCCSY